MSRPTSRPKEGEAAINFVPKPGGGSHRASGRVLTARHAMGDTVVGEALVAKDGFSARYDLDRIAGIFSRPAHKLAGQGALAFVTSDRPGAATQLPFAATGHPLTDPLALIVTFYGFVEALARHRGLNPDTPPMLKKVTETL